MALIRCPECGREISDRAPACIHCGCPLPAPQPAPHAAANPNALFHDAPGGHAPAQSTDDLTVPFHAVLSGAENGRSVQRVFVTEMNRHVEFTVPNTLKTGQTVKVQLQNSQSGPDRTIRFPVLSVKAAQEAGPAAPAASAAPAAPAARPAPGQDSIAVIKRYTTNGFMDFLASRRYYSLMFIYFGAIVYLFTKEGSYAAGIAAAGMAPFFLPLLIAKMFYPMHHLKKYMRRHGLEEAVRNDTGYMNVAISVYNALPGKKTLAYIRRLNAEAADRIRQQLAAKK